MVKKFLNLLHKKGDPLVKLESERLFLRTFVESDAKSLAELMRRNKYFWAIHEPLHEEDFYTEEAQFKKILESVHLLRANREYSFGIYPKGSNHLIGHISLYAIKRLPYNSAFIGYSIDEKYTRKGIATEAVKQIIQFAFHNVKLNRIEAYVSPKNEGSIKVLENANLVREGLLRDLLYINGKWEDHYLYSIIRSDYGHNKR